MENSVELIKDGQVNWLKLKTHQPLTIAYIQEVSRALTQVAQGREPRILVTVCEGDFCLKQDFRSIEGIKLMASFNLLCAQMLSFCVPNLFVMHTKCEGAAIYFALCHDYRMMPANGTISFDSFRVTPAMTLIAREMLPQKHLRKLSLGLEINSKEALKDHVVSEVFADTK